MIKRLEKVRFQSVEELRVVLKPDTAIGVGKWIDLAGMFAPEEEVKRLLNDIESGAVSSMPPSPYHDRPIRTAGKKSGMAAEAMTWATVSRVWMARRR